MARAAHANNRLDRALLAVCATAALVVRVMPSPVREPIASTLRRTVLAPMVMLQERAELSRRAFLEHDARMSVRDSMALRRFDDTALQAENERLRALVGLGTRLRWGFVPAEALHGRAVRDEATVILSAGTRAGVQPLSPVVAPEGLVGVVDHVDPTMSHALLWTHSEFRVSAMAEDASAFGIVQAHVTGTPPSYMMEMRGVPFRTSIKPNTMIVTSGLGGVYPRGIPIGRVVGETKSIETWARTYMIRPAVFPADVYSVMILRPDRAAHGVNNVWAVGAIADSTVRKIVVAGDSMARTAALAEARARQAAQDSTRLDSLRRAGVLVPPPVGVPPTPAPKPGDSLRRPIAPVVPSAPGTPGAPRPGAGAAPRRPIPTRRDSAGARPDSAHRDTTHIP